MINMVFDNIWLNLTAFLLYTVTVTTCVYVVVSENRNPIRSLAWVIALIFLPGIGLLFYLFFGRSLKGKRMISRRNKRKLMNQKMPRRFNIKDIELPPQQRQLIKLCHSLCQSPLTLGNDIEIFTNGIDKFNALEKDIRNARKSIFIQYYIFEDDKLGVRIADLLIQKAREGVDVKVLYDHVGSFSASSKFFKKMRDAGVQIHPFFRVTFPQLANRINWRNHRKVVVIDNKIGYIGGMNIADRYINGTNDKFIWRDTHCRLTGDIVEQLYYSFMIDWNFKEKSPVFPPFSSESKPSTSLHHGMQFIHSGPADRYHSLALIFLKAITSAQNCIYIQTPYFLPTDSLLNALETAALSKVDVRIMIPASSDSKMLQYASFSYVKHCLKAGIKIYLYNPGMLHAKTLIIDNNIVSTGSTNFDFRSFENNFECNLMVYDESFNASMKNIFLNDMKKCTKLNLTEWRKRPLSQRFVESIIRLFAPIL